MSANATISVIVPVHNGEAWIGECIDSLLDQSRPPDEVIVVDDASTDETVSRLGDRRIRLLALPENRGRAGARNAGIEAATGDIVVFAEDDGVYPHEYLERVTAPFADPSVACALGPYRVHDADSFVRRCRDVERRVHYARYVPYTGWAYRRRDLVRVGGFDEALESAEDVDLGRRIVPAAGRIVYVPEALWYHREPRTLSAFLRRRFRAGAGNILYKMRERRAPAPLRAGIMMIALAIVIAAAWWMAANGAARALPLLLLAVLLLPAVTRARFISRAIRLGADARYAIGWVYLEIAGWIAAAAGSLSALLRGHERTRHSLRGR